MKKIISLLLVLCMVLTLGTQLQANATQSSSSFSMAFTLTGDGAKDICAIALAQLGKTGSELGYSEMWCADFVSDCARLANQSEAIPFCGVVVAHDGTKNICEAIQNAGGKTVYDIPEKGDIAICNGWGHVEIIVDVNGETVTVVGGNGSGNGPYYSKVYKDTHHYKDSWFNQILRPNYRSKDLSKPVLTGLRDKYPTGESVVLQCDPVSGANQYSFVAEKKDGSSWKVVHREPRSTSRECTIKVTTGEYRVHAIAYDTNRKMPDGSDYLYKAGDKVYFTVAGEHVCDFSEYAYYWKAHPHYNCYRCSICGKVNEDRNSSNYIENCRECNRPEKPAFTNLYAVYSEGETVTFRWTKTSHTTHYNLWLWKQDDSGTWEDEHGKWKTYEHLFDVNNGKTYTLPVGEYRVLLQAYNKDFMEEDGSDYVHSESGFIYFSVKKPCEVNGHKTELRNAKDATCTADGYTGDQVCTVCGKTIQKGSVIKATGHKTELRNAKDATCTADGYTGDQVCKVCGKTVQKGSVIQATGHKLELRNAKDATCTADGYTGDQVCTVCGKTIQKGSVIKATGHKPELRNAKDATCTADGYTGDQVCTVCGKTIQKGSVIPATGHKWNDGKVTTQPTETAEGVKTFTCTVCGATKTEAVPKLTPKPTAEPTTEPTTEPSTEPTTEPTNEPSDGNPFKDVKSGAYYYDPVLWAVNHEPQITNGTGPDTFSPAATCTRGQVVTFLWRAAGEPEPTTTENPFKDVKEGAYYYKAVLWAVEQGITNGTSKTTFSPANPCTRAHVVTFLYRSEGSPELTSTVNPFKDVKEGQYYTPAVLWAVSREITNGTDATHFSPSNPCTRGQIVTFLYRDMK